MFNKRKLFNDPIYGFITIPTELIYDIINHPFFQRLRRIKQLGLADFTYPGALHTRFHHALGAMHLMGLALNTLRSKGHNISDKETESAQVAILLHDIGHGPFSHALEHTLLSNTSHESVSKLLIHLLNIEFSDELSLAIQMTNGTYQRPFFHQLISSQLDIDRLDYLQRDCFFTGVSEGTIGADRIIKMLELVNEEIVIEEKGIYSIENFLNARRLMYWQVYLHKTVLSAEQMIIQIVKRARELNANGTLISEPLQIFLQETINLQSLTNNSQILEAFTLLDDYDLWAAIKKWSKNEDPILQLLCNNLLNRKLYKVSITNDMTAQYDIDRLYNKIKSHSQFDTSNYKYLVTQGTISNAAYNAGEHQINILMRNGQILDIASASDLPNIKALSNPVKKYFLCWWRELDNR